MKRKNLLSIIGLIVFVALVGGVSYSYFVYNKNVASISLTTGNIAINLSSVNNNMNLRGAIPKTDNEGINSSNYITFTVTSTVDTEKIYYEVYILPRKGNTLNTEYLKVYLTDQNNNVLTNVTFFDNLPSSTLGDGRAIYRAVIDLNNNQSSKTETKNFRLRLWLDESYDDLSAKAFNFDIYLYAKNVSNNYRITSPICRRVTNVEDLHTETCNQGSNYCYSDGYYALGSEGSTTITYGNAKSMGTSLVTGDAFDCDIDGFGYNERFYYVSDKWNEGTNINSFNDTTAVLIYYRNSVNGELSFNGTAYHNSDNWHGPITSNLPDWSNNQLVSSSRTIYACNDANCSSTPTLTTNNGNSTITNPFIYSYRSRLLTLPEVIKGCKSVNNNTSLATIGSLKQCNFLFEGTKYSDSTNSVDSIWLETPDLTSNTNVMNLKSSNRNITSSASNSTYGIRPVIEVSKENIEY